MYCWSCGTKLEEFSFGKMPFRAECSKCNASLHCCKNCVYYKPGLPNDCAVPGTDFVRDRSAMNLCEDFKALGKPPTAKPSLDEIAKKLFLDEPE